VFERHELRDPRALRALAHPSRLRLLEHLAYAGAATATELAEQVGESPANCSWHLRQLARYGFVEETGGGVGRQRPWRLVPEVRSWDRDGTAEPDLARAGDAAMGVLLDGEVAALRDWLKRRREEPVAWRQAAFVDLAFTWLTRDELAEIERQITGLLTQQPNRLDPADRPPGAQPVRLVAWGFPARPTGLPATPGDPPTGDADDA
jgi:DNA-binding transcriptional ArsR family regulator